MSEGDACRLCGRDRAEAELLLLPMPSPDFHPECGVRMALGGIGHLEDHAYWCGERHDPDAGLSFRESALRVAAWLTERAAQDRPTTAEVQGWVRTGAESSDVSDVSAVAGRGDDEC